MPHESIAKWFTIHGGTYAREVQEDTTHLICSVEEYKARGAQGNHRSISFSLSLSLPFTVLEHSQREG